MSPDDTTRLLHMIEAGESIARFLVGRDRGALDSDEMLLLAVVRALQIFGEAASQLSEQARTAAPNVPWKAIIGMRNRIVHAYWDINVVWKAAAEEVPALLPILRELVGQTGAPA